MGLLSYTWTITPNDIDREIKVWEARGAGDLKNGWDFLAFNYDAEQIINVLKYGKEINKSVLITCRNLFWKAEIIYDKNDNNNTTTNTVGNTTINDKNNTNINGGSTTTNENKIIIPSNEWDIIDDNNNNIKIKTNGGEANTDNNNIKIKTNGGETVVDDNYIKIKTNGGETNIDNNKIYYGQNK